MNPPNAPASPVVEDPPNAPVPGRRRPVLIAAAVLAVGVLAAVGLARRTDGISGAVVPTEPVTTAAPLTTAAPPTTAAPVTTAAPAPGPGAPVGATPTAIVSVSPLGADGHLRPGLHISQDVPDGRCTAGRSSLVPGAARCFAGDLVLDPCWPDAASGSTGGVCLNDPFAPDEAVRLSAATGLTGRPGVPDLDRPWGVQLASGDLCFQSTGAHSVIGDAIVDYRCGESLVLLRGIDRTGAAWTVRTADCCTAPARGSTATISKAWYGGP
jgi:hypothetical protein